MPTPPSYQKVNPADQPILYLALSSDTLPLSTVDEYAETLMAQRISMVDGVAQVQVFGSQKYAVRVQLDPKALASRGLGIDEVAERQSRTPTSTCPRERSTAPNRPLRSRPPVSSPTPRPTGPLIVAYRNGAPVRLDELGQVIDSVENDKIAALVSTNSRAIVLAIQRQPGTNTIEVVDSINKLLPEFCGSRFRPSVNIDTLV